MTGSYGSRVDAVGLFTAAQADGEYALTSIMWIMLSRFRECSGNKAIFVSVLGKQKV